MIDYKKSIQESLTLSWKEGRRLILGVSECANSSTALLDAKFERDLIMQGAQYRQGVQRISRHLCT